MNGHIQIILKQSSGNSYDDAYWVRILQEVFSVNDLCLDIAFSALMLLVG